MPHTSGRARARCEDARRTAPTVIAPVSLPTIRYVTAPRLSVIVLVYNEAESIAPLYEELSGVLEGLDVPYEIVYVDDGSRDGSTEKMAQLALRDSHLRVVSFRRNFGQTAAVQAGIDNSTGEILIFMDGDMQNDPHDIPRLLDRINQGDDVVSGWRNNRNDDPSRVGARISELEVNHRKRSFGSSKYSLSRTSRVLLDLMTVKLLGEYSTKPIYFFGFAAFGLWALALVAATLVLIQKFLPPYPYAHNNPLLLLAVFLGIVGVQFILMGLLAELSIRTYHESQGKSVYVVRELVEGQSPRKQAATNGRPAVRIRNK